MSLLWVVVVVVVVEPARYLLRLQRVIGRLDGHVLLAVDLHTLLDDLLCRALVRERVYEGLDFGIGELLCG